MDQQLAGGVIRVWCKGSLGKLVELQKQMSDTDGVWSVAECDYRSTGEKARVLEEFVEIQEDSGEPLRTLRR